MNSEVGWRFPPTNGGIGSGFNDSGIAHFTGAPLPSLARETIQNSLDARKNLGESVHVSFELIRLKPADIGRDELVRAIDSCRSEQTNDDVVEAALTDAKKSINKNEISCLRISDRNTIGLKGEHWRTLVKMQGVSYKNELVGAGGSHGIGKYAPFSVSSPRTVFYWTCYQDNGEDIEQLQGKSVLMSHRSESEEGETQGTGFYGIKKDCSELTTDRIPECFRIISKKRRPVYGTSLVIVGFQATEDWRRLVAASVIENFFHAISTGNLTVTIEPDDSCDETQLFEIERNSLSKWFTELVAGANLDDDAGDEDGSALEQARRFWEISSEESPSAEKQDSDLGHCKLWVQVAEELPSKVAFVRRTGMVITTQQRGLIRFPGFRKFAALCVFEDPEGNELLRRMENPRHDQFEPDRLPESERARGRRALNRITSWIRDEIRKEAGPPEGGAKTILSELAVFLPDFQPDEPFEEASPDGTGNKEPGFGERVKVALKPIRRSARFSMLGEDQDAGERTDGDGDDTGEFGGGGTGDNAGGGGSDGSGYGEGEGGTGVRGGDRKGKLIPVFGVRILAIEGRDNCYRLSFRSDTESVVRLELEEAGDSSAIRRTDVRAIDDDVSLDSIQLAKGHRTVVEITANAPIGGRAWRLLALAEDGGSQ